METGQDGNRCPSLLNTAARHETSRKLFDLSGPWFSFPPYQAAGLGTGEDCIKARIVAITPQITQR